MQKLLNEDSIVLDANISNRNEAIDTVGRLLIDQNCVTKEYIKAMHAREDVISTYIGNHVAIPHGINGSENSILKSGISFLQIPRGVKYGDDIANIVIGVAGKDRSHMKILMKITEIINNKENVDNLIHAQTKEDVLKIMSNISID